MASPDWIFFIIASFAVYRVSRMLADEDGPFDLFARFRGVVDPDQRTWVGRGLACPLCIGVWVALIVAILLGVYGLYNPWLWPLWWFGLAGLAAWLTKMER
jgi:hypothetical protein